MNDNNDDEFEIHFMDLTESVDEMMAAGDYMTALTVVLDKLNWCAAIPEGSMDSESGLAVVSHMIIGDESVVEDKIAEIGESYDVMIPPSCQTEEHAGKIEH